MTDPPTLRPPPAEDVDRELTRVRSFLGDCGFHDLEGLMREEAERARAAEASVVVVGETKRGKSSLVNALLGRPGLSPVDADIATSAYLLLRHAEAPAAQVVLAGEEEPRPIALDEVARYATVHGNPGNELGVRWVEVGVDAPILRGLALVDTPGVGGLLSGHGDQTLEALRRATALLFVLEAGAPVTEPELEFLRRARDRIETVVFALTKVDQNPGWRAIADDDRALLEREGLGEAPLVPVSSVLAQRAARHAAGDPDLAADLRAESGLDALADALAHVARRAPLAAQANRLRAAQTALSVAYRTLGEQAQASEGDPRLLEALRAEDARLGELREETTSWGPELSHDLGTLRADVRDHVRRTQARLRREYEQSIPRTAADDLPVVADALGASVNAMHLEALTLLGERLEGVGERLMGELAGTTGLPGALGAIVGRAPDAALTPPPRPGETPATPMDTFTNVSALYIGSNMARSLMTALGSVGAPIGLGVLLSPATWAVAIPAGLVWMRVLSRHRRRAVDVQAMRVWAQGCIGEAGAEVLADVERRLGDAQYEIGRAMRALIAARTAEVAAARRECEAALRRDRAERQRAVAALHRRQSAALRLRGGTDRMLEALRLALAPANGSASATIAAPEGA